MLQIQAITELEKSLLIKKQLLINIKNINYENNTSKYHEKH